MVSPLISCFLWVGRSAISDLPLRLRTQNLPFWCAICAGVGETTSQCSATLPSSKRCIGDITQSVLTENLRGLQRDGYLTRTIDPGPPVELTPLGRSLLEMLKPLVFWAHEQMDEVRQFRMKFDREQTS